MFAHHLEVSESGVTLFMPLRKGLFLWIKRRARIGIGDGLLRISTGIEDVRDLLEDLAQALDG